VCGDMDKVKLAEEGFMVTISNNGLSIKWRVKRTWMNI
jgi:hypothetical protein